MKKKGNWIVSLLAVCLLWLLSAFSAEAATIYDSPYVTFAPDGEAWTTCDDDTDYTHYKEDVTVVYTGIASTLRATVTGEHYYNNEISGTIPIGRWVVRHEPAQCIHNAYLRTDSYHGLTFRKKTCEGYYNSGWVSFCADCDEKISGTLIYMSKEAAESIDYMESVEGLDYYYLCPHCTNLEQGVEIGPHTCKAISWNQYKVEYKVNAGALGSTGSTPDSYHMYNNENMYNGETVTPQTHLTLNGFKITGYAFVGWNTKADGSGTWYSDGQEILNLTTVNYEDDKINGKITLYAQWERAESTLRILAGEGSYEGRSRTEITQYYGTSYTLNMDSLIPPDGATVSFDTKGGAAIAAIEGIQHFTHWNKPGIFLGYLNSENDIYYFSAPDGQIDTLQAVYARDAIILPEPKKANASFGGWYYDAAFTKPAGGAGDKITPTKDVTLYAQWVDLVLYAEDNYTANGGKGAVDLSWVQADGKNKIYKLYQSLDAVNWKLISAASEIGKELVVKEDFAYTGKESKYTVPYTGFYHLTAFAGQGGDSDSYSGGLGGGVEGTFFLKKGDVLTYIVGGQGDTATGGGAGSNGGDGGGYTKITKTSDGVDTLLLVAGGGGGASAYGDGLAGGLEDALREDGVSEGKDGEAGGGGGYVGGSTEGVVPVPFTQEYAFTGNIQMFVAPYTGTYKLEVWGAQGADSTKEDEDDDEDPINVYGIGGLGGYSYGNVTLNAGDMLYVVVGGAGKTESSSSSLWASAQYLIPGGYNGGGGCIGFNSNNTGAGGGATHIATAFGLLNSLEDKKETVLIVAGGGGGSKPEGSSEADSITARGGAGGGTTGGTGTKKSGNSATGGTQTAGGTGGTSGSFGKGGESGNVAGGGGGWYGGGAYSGAGGAGGGSGYLKSTLTNAAMESGVWAGNGKAVISWVG